MLWGNSYYYSIIKELPETVISEGIEGLRKWDPLLEVGFGSDSEDSLQFVQGFGMAGRAHFLEVSQLPSNCRQVFNTIEAQ